MPKTLIYAGIGSRKTPPMICNRMSDIAWQLAASGWLLRSGHAEGADMAFETGCILALGKKEIFVPWFGFNGAPQDHPDYIRPKATQGLADYAAQFHPAWDKCSDVAKLMHMRNVCQILGEHGDAPVDLVICWTSKGSGSGGTGQAIRIAEHHNIPVFDLATFDMHVAKKFCDFIRRMEEQISPAPRLRA